MNSERTHSGRTASSQTGKSDAAHAARRERLAALSPERRARLLDPAEAEFAEHGFAGASLNRILAAAGVSKGQAYHYIADKADLHALVVERCLRRLAEAVAMPPILATDVPTAFWGALAEASARIDAAFRDDPRLAQIARSLHDEGPALQAPLHPLRDSLEEIVRHGQSLGAVREDMPVSLIAAMVFAAARELDRWFAAHWESLPPEQAFAINEAAFAALQQLAAPGA